MVISLRPPRRKITCGNWNNTNIHIDWKCMKQPMWEVPAFWLTKIAYIMFGLLHQSLWIGEKSYIFPHHHDPSADRRSDAPTPKNRFKQDPIAWPLDPLTPWPIPIIPSPSSTLAKIWRQELCEQRRRSSHNTLSRFLQRSTALGSSSYERNIQMCG